MSITVEIIDVTFTVFIFDSICRYVVTLISPETLKLGQFSSYPMSTVRDERVIFVSELLVILNHLDDGCCFGDKIISFHFVINLFVDGIQIFDYLYCKSTLMKPH